MYDYISEWGLLIINMFNVIIKEFLVLFYFVCLRNKVKNNCFK